MNTWQKELILSEGKLEFLFSSTNFRTSIQVNIRETFHNKKYCSCVESKGAFNIITGFTHR